MNIDTIACRSLVTLVLAASALVGTARAVDIVVTSTLDFAEVDADIGREDNYTCGFSAGAFFEPAPNGICTLRRAVLEAGVRPDSDRPIRILFDIPASDPNYDPALEIWEVQIDSSFVWEIDRRFLTDDGGRVTIDGASQPIGRNDGPRIMINTNSDNSPIGGRSLEVRTSNNVIKDVGFKGGGQIILYEGGNTVENIWMGLRNDGSELSLASDANAQARRAMARGGIIMPSRDSDDNIIRNNIVIGAFERAIRVSSTGGENNLIVDNWIGTNADGVVPVDGIVDCARDPDFDETLWYGGEGIQVLGRGNIVSGNTLAGLHKTQAAFDTPPIALEISGFRNTVTDNVIGLDAEGNEIGVCGQGMLLQGSEGVVTENHLFLTRNGFDPGDVDTDLDSAILMQSFQGVARGDEPNWMQVWNNVIDGGNFNAANFHAYRFVSPGVPIEMRQFIPAKVTSIEGLTVSGTNGDPLPLGPGTDCPNCTIYLYLDDRDDRIESFDLLGTATADSNGNWTTTISRLLASNEGIRTQSQANAPGVMHVYGAMTTSRLSDELYFPAQSDVIFRDQFESLKPGAFVD